MRNSNITKKITQGMYVLTSQGGGCVVDAVSQISSGDKPLISVAVMKKNYTNELLHKNRTFALSVLGMKANPEIIKTFGFNSMREMNKFEKVKTNQVMGVPVIADSLGYMVCEIIDHGKATGILLTRIKNGLQLKIIRNIRDLQSFS